MTNWLSVPLWMLYSINYNYRFCRVPYYWNECEHKQSNIIVSIWSRLEYIAARFSESKNNGYHFISSYIHRFREMIFYCSVGHFPSRCVSKIFYFKIMKKEEGNNSCWLCVPVQINCIPRFYSTFTPLEWASTYKNGSIISQIRFHQP